jgi:hypothetical protein
MNERVVVGVDFGAPQRARDQRRKIVVIAATSRGARSYRIDRSGLNARLFASEPPGWSALELVDALLERPARVVGFDFPFSVPDALLRDPAFSSESGYPHGAFGTWHAFNDWIAKQLPLTDPLDYAPFAAWRDPRRRARLWTKRATDIAASAQPPLKDLFQATFQMTLLGNAVLARLLASPHYRALPFHTDSRPGELLEVYPRATLRAMGLTRYKSLPGEAMRLGLAACAALGIKLELEDDLLALGSRYSSGTANAPDHDVADAFIALCTSILHAEGACRPSIDTDAHQMMSEGTIWVPDPIRVRPRRVSPSD